MVGYTGKESSNRLAAALTLRPSRARVNKLSLRFGGAVSCVQSAAALTGGRVHFLGK